MTSFPHQTFRLETGTSGSQRWHAATCRFRPILLSRLILFAVSQISVKLWSLIRTRAIGCDRQLYHSERAAHWVSDTNCVGGFFFHRGRRLRAGGLADFDGGRPGGGSAAAGGEFDWLLQPAVGAGGVAVFIRTGGGLQRQRPGPDKMPKAISSSSRTSTRRCTGRSHRSMI